MESPSQPATRTTHSVFVTPHDHTRVALEAPTPDSDCFVNEVVAFARGARGFAASAGPCAKRSFSPLRLRRHGRRAGKPHVTGLDDQDAGVLLAHAAVHKELRAVDVLDLRLET